MTSICATWVDGGAPDTLLTAIGIAGFLLATVAVLRDERRSRRAPEGAAARPAPPRVTRS